jgi:hypothetical protein
MPDGIKLRFKSQASPQAAAQIQEQPLPPGVSYRPNAAPVFRGEQPVMGESGQMAYAQGPQTKSPQMQGLRFAEKSNLTPEQAAAEELKFFDLTQVLPESNKVTRGLIGALQTQTFNPEEFTNILKAADPKIQVSRAGGQIFVTHPDVGQTYTLNKPGFTFNDGVQISSAILAATPAGFGRSVVGRMAGEALIQGGIELAQMSKGGEFNPEEVAMAATFSGLSDLPGVVGRARSGRAVSGQVAGTGLEQAAPEIRAVGGQATQTPVRAAENLRDVIQPDPVKTQAVRELGMEEVTPARIVSQNPQYVQTEQAIAQIPGSKMAPGEAQFVRQLSDKADEFIDTYGGTTDVTGLDEAIRSQIARNIEDLASQSNKLYDRIDEANITRIRITDGIVPIRNALRSKAIDLGGIGNLSKLEEDIYREVEKAIRSQRPGLTYGRIDELRKEIGEKYGKSVTGLFSGDAASFQLSRLYDVLTNAQEQALNQVGPEYAGIWNEAKALVAKRKELEDIASKVAGRNLEKNILPQLTRSMNRLADSGVDADFLRVIRAIPEDMRQEAMISAIGNIFTRGGKTQTQLVPGQYAGWWNKIKRNKGAREALFKNLPEGAPRFLENLAIISKSYADAAASAPRTGITNAMEMMNSDGGFISRVAGAIPFVGDKAGGALRFIFAETPVDAIEASAKLLGDSNFKRIITRSASGEPVDRAEGALRKSKVYTDWLQTLPANKRERALSLGIADYFLGDEE